MGAIHTRLVNLHGHNNTGILLTLDSSKRVGGMIGITRHFL